jgi:nitroreductase
VVTDPEVLERLSVAKPHGASFLKNAPLCIVVLGDPEKSQVWVEDCAIASIYIHLAAASMGLGSCWIQIRKRVHDETQSAGAYVAGVLGVPSPLEVESIVAVGYPDEEKSPHAKASLQYEKVFKGAYGTPYGS